MKRLKLLLLLFLLMGCASLDDPQPTPVAVNVATIVVPTNAPTIPPTTATPLPTPTALPTPTTFCPEIPRPALLVATAGALALTNPQTGASCPLPGNPATAVQIRENGLYTLEPETAVIRHTPDGKTTSLPFTRPPAGSFLNSFAISRDGSRIAWTAVRGETDGSTHNQLTIANINGQERMDFPEIVLPDGRFVELVQIGYDNHQLFFAYQPAAVAQLGVGNGRYDSLYTTCCGAFPQKMLDCTDLGLSLCIGDLSPDGQQVAYVDDQAIIVADADGVTRATLPVPDALSGYPLFNLASDLFFYAAPETTLYRVAFPYSEPIQPIVTAAGLLPPLQWLGDDQLVTAWRDEAGQIGHALLTLADGTLTPLPPAQSLTTLTPLAVPVAANTELSPNGRWQVRYGQSIAVAASSDELETFPSGAKYQVFLELAAVDGVIHHTIVDEWRGAGLGQDWPAPYRWSADGQAIYLTDAASMDGCGIFGNGTHLDRVDLVSGAVTELLPRQRTGNFALSPDEERVAFVAGGSNGQQLVLLDLASGSEQAVLLDSDTNVQAGNLVWSPNSQSLLVHLAHAPCSQEMRYSLLHFDLTTGTLVPLIVQATELPQVVSWPTPPRARLIDDEGVSLFLDVATGETSSTERVDGLCVDRSHLGWFFTPAPATCPMDVATASPAVAQQFEHGQMVWQEASLLLTVLFDDGDYALFSVPPDLVTNDAGADLTPPEGLLAPRGALTAVWLGQLPLSADVGERLGWATTPLVPYTAQQQLDISSAPLSAGPQFVLAPDVTYLSLAGGKVVGLANGRYFAAGYLLVAGEER